MKAYQIYPSEMRTYQDRVSGVTVHKLTDYLCDSYHTYFTNNGFWDQNRRLLFTSDRGNVSNLYSIELESGEISRLTDFQPGERTPIKFTNDINPKKTEIYYVRGGSMYAYDFVRMENRLLYTKPDGFNLKGGLVGADGKYCYAVLLQDLSDRIYQNLSASYVGFEEYFRAKPDCRILRIDTEKGGGEVLWQEKCWLGHINPSPVQPTFLTFCHEGPWNLVDNRIWFMDTVTGKPRALRPKRVEGEQIGHEYWYADGVRIGYQVHRTGEGSFFGVVDYRGEHEFEAPCVPFPSPDHVHSIDFNLIVSDSGKTIKLYRYNGKDFDDARILCMHDGSFFQQYHHPHPKIMPDGKHVLYNSDESGYCNMYIAEIPEDMASLSKVTE